MALLATACGSGTGGKTLCSAYMSMDGADQRSTITTMLQEDGQSSPSSDEVSETELSAAAYCLNPSVNVNTIDGYTESRPP